MNETRCLNCDSTDLHKTVGRCEVHITKRNGNSSILISAEIEFISCTCCGASQPCHNLDNITHAVHSARPY
jgi:hypothetical protein